MPLGNRSSGSIDHFLPMLKRLSFLVRPNSNLSNWVASTDSIVVECGENNMTFWKLFRSDLKSEGFVEVGIQSALLHRGLLLLELFPIHEQVNLDEGIGQTTKVHLFQILAFQNADGQLARSRYVSERKANVTKCLLQKKRRKKTFGNYEDG